MAMRGRAGWSDKTVTGASSTGSYEVTAARPDVRNSATGGRRQISAKTTFASVSTPGQTTPDDADPILTVRHATALCRWPPGAGPLKR